jgi:hypothetical protein
MLVVSLSNRCGTQRVMPVRQAKKAIIDGARRYEARLGENRDKCSINLATKLINNAAYIMKRVYGKRKALSNAAALLGGAEGSSK